MFFGVLGMSAATPPGAGAPRGTSSATALPESFRAARPLGSSMIFTSIDIAIAKRFDNSAAIP